MVIDKLPCSSFLSIDIRDSMLQAYLMPTLRAALLTLGYGPTVQSLHGFRATARTILAEVLNFDPLVIEAQLAHAVNDANGRPAHNRAPQIRGHAPVIRALVAPVFDAPGRTDIAAPRNSSQNA